MITFILGLTLTMRIIEIKPKLQEAIDKLDEIDVPQEDREAVVENAEFGSSTFKEKTIRVLKAGGTEALAGMTSYSPMINIALAAYQGFLEAKVLNDNNTEQKEIPNLQDGDN